MKINVNGSTRVLAKARAFSNRGIQEYCFDVTDGVVRVFDSLANHYTTCHCLSKRAQNRIKKMTA